MLFIPLGTRCSAASILQNRFDVRKFSLPFDWIDTPLKNLAQFISIEYKDVAPFIKNYFSEVKSNTQRHPDGTWFPHDIYLPDFKSEAEMYSTAIEKYTRRLERLHENLDTDRDKTFLSVLSSNHMDNMDDFIILKETIERRTKGELLFVTVNVVDHDIIDGNHYNFSIELDKSAVSMSGKEWADWEDNIVSAIDSNSVLKEVFRTKY